ncbi:retrotransposon protein, putative, ty1-copia subclass [Tanacetum coccineum]
MDGAVHTYKARLVAKGYTQTPGIDYEETFSPVADIRAIRILIAIAAYYDYEIWQMDVKTAFLNGYLNEEVYMEQPEGFVNPKYPNRVCKLKRSIYGLKQASRQWNKRFDDEIKKFGFSQNADEPCVYLKASGSNVTFLILYVDDILIMGNSIPMLQDVKSYLGKCFAMKDLGEAAYILGIKIYRDRSRRLIGLCQSAYIEKILKRFHMENSKRGSIPMQDKLRLSKSQGASTPAELKRMQSVPYASAVGSIMYAVRCTRPDVAFAQNITSRFQQNPGDLHWTTVKNILKYLRNTKDMFLVYGGDLKRELRVSCYTDAGYLTDADDLKSQTGYVFVLNGGAVDWKSAKQSIFATSSAEAEYIAAYDASKEAVWVRKFISGLANESGITKGASHFRAKVHYLREVIKFGDIKLEKVHTDDNLADPFTKALAFPKHSEHTQNIGMLPASSFMQLGLLSLACPLNYGSPNHSRTLGSGDDKEECNARQFNRTTGKVCILTKYPWYDGEISLDDDNSDDKNEDSDDNNNGETQNGEDCDDKVMTHDLSGESSSVRINSNNTLPDENTKLERVSGFVASGKHTGDHIEEGSTSVTGVNDKNKNKPLGVSDSDSSESKVRVRGASTQPKKSCGRTTKTRTTSQPIQSTSREAVENEAISDSFSKIQICNLRILSNQNNDIELESNEVNNTIVVGGILAVWDTNNFTMTDSLEGEGFLAILGNWRNIDQPCLMVVVYAPQDYRKKKTLWNNLARLVDSHNNFSILIGDFNEVRFESERMGTEFDPRGAYEFNDFIHSSGLIDMPLVGKRFTRMDNLGSKHSKIDHHTPLILLNTTHDFGPIPFRLYNSWMDHPKFADPNQASWASSFVGLQPGVGFKNKIDCLDNKAEVSLLTPIKVETRTSSIKFLADMENRKVKDLKQKAKIKWALEALNIALLEATNNNIFHGIQVGKDKIHVSHLQFADDALIIGDWSCTNAKNLSRILTCFHLASRLKVNFNKSKLYGVGVTNSAKMSRCHNWKPLVDRFHKRLLKWESKSLSFGGRLTLVRSVLGSLGVYYFSNFKAPKKVISYRWRKILGNLQLAQLEKFSVKDMRSHITSLSHPWTSQPTRWNNSIPSKVNINTWRAMNSRLPTRTNLDLRGMDLDSIRCVVCDEEIETEEHVFVHCKIVVDIWKDIFKLWKIPILHLNNLFDVLLPNTQDSDIEVEEVFNETADYMASTSLKGGSDSVKNDVDLSTNGVISNLASNKANFSGSSIWIVESSNDEGKPLEKIDSSGDHDSEDEVSSVDNKMADFLTTKKAGYDTNTITVCFYHEIKKIGESYCFANGWSNVVKDAELGIADFLIFELVNETTFKMKIYTPDGCEKFLIPRNHVKHRSDDHDGDDPSFVSIISNKSHKSVLRLPENFVGLPGIDREGTIMMKNLAGKEWRIGIRLDKSYLTEHYYLSTGWCKFRRYNKLSEGDKCVFKYIRSESKLCLTKVTKQEEEGTSTASADAWTNLLFTIALVQKMQAEGDELYSSSSQVKANYV